MATRRRPLPAWPTVGCGGWPEKPGHLRCRRRRTYRRPCDQSSGAVGRVHTLRGACGWSAGVVSV